MARDDAPPFERGSTFYNGDPIDSSNLGGLNYEGKEYVFEVNSATDNPSTTIDYSGRQVRVRVVRNVSSIPLVPGKIAKYQTSVGFPFQTRVDGYTSAITDTPAGVIDEKLPAAGVAINDLFYLVVDGPTQVESITTGSITLAVGTAVVPAAGTSSVSADSGCIAAQDLTGATATLGNNIQHRLGYSEQAQTTLSALTQVVVRNAAR